MMQIVICVNTHLQHVVICQGICDACIIGTCNVTSVHHGNLVDRLLSLYALANATKYILVTSLVSMVYIDLDKILDCISQSMRFYGACDPFRE